MLQLIWLVSLGYIVGAFGTLIGAGGGFILVPLLLLIYPDKSPESITSISLAVVFFNALSGSIAYTKMRRVDYKSALIFAAATIPGSILGVFTVSYIPRHTFDIVFGILLMILAIYLFFKKNNKGPRRLRDAASGFKRKIIDAEGNTYEFAYNKTTGVIISLFVGYLSSLLGIGGGIIHVPAMVNLLNFPVHLASATSHFILAITSFTGSIMHLFRGDLAGGYLQIAGLSVGVILGAQLGAKLSKRIHGTFIIKALAVALGLVGLRILLL